MKEFINGVRKDKITFYIFLASLVVAGLTCLIIFLNYFNLPPFVPVFNQLPWGNNRLTQTPGIFIPIILFIVVFLFNFGFAGFLYTKNNPLLARIISSVTLTVSVINFFFVVKVLLLIL